MDLPHIITITYPSGLTAPLTTGYAIKRAAVKEFFKRIEPRTADVLHDSQYTSHDSSITARPQPYLMLFRSAFIGCFWRWM